MKKTHPVLSPGRKRAFFLLTLLLPFLLLGLLELGLRLFSYGTDLSLFTTEAVNGREYCVLNPQTKLRYFSRMQFNPTIAPDYFLVPKPQGTYRIFCLGGSTTVGYPYWYNGSFSSFLRDRIRRIFPDRSLEVINIGMTATNSYTVNDMARDVLAYEPDLLVVYDGHNEFYGALGIASNETMGRIRWLTHLSLRLVHLRTYQLLRDAFAKTAALFQGTAAHMPVTLMESLARGQNIPYGSRTYLDCLSIFKANLAELKGMCTSAGIPVIVASQVSNLRDMPPFTSQEPEDPALTAELRTTLAQGESEWKKGSIVASAASFARAVALDSVHAFARYMHARCYDTLGRTADALLEYLKARDYDELRFRASSDFNDAIREVADDRTVFFADMEKTFEEHSAGSLIGKNLMIEHLHPNAMGYFLMGKEYAGVMREHQLFATAGEWAASDTLSDSLLWLGRNVTEVDERIAQRRTEILTSGWPFRSQVPVVDAVREGDTLGTIVENVTRARWPWTRAHEAAAEYYLGRGEHENAIKEYTVIINQFPLIEVKTYLTLAKMLLDAKRITEMQQVLLASLKIQPTILAYRALGDISLNAGRAREALPYYRKMFDFPQTRVERVENGYLLALAYSRSDSSREAVDWLLGVLRMQPDYQPAILLLQKIKSSATR